MFHLSHLFSPLNFSFFLCSVYSLLVISRGFSLFKCNRPRRTIRQAVAKSVAEVLPYEFCLAVYDFNRSFVTGFSAETAAVALFFIYMDDFSNHCAILLVCDGIIILVAT